MTTTLRKLRAARACADRYKHLRQSLGKSYGDNTPITPLQILTHNGFDDCRWALEYCADFKSLFDDYNAKRRPLFNDYNAECKPLFGVYNSRDYWAKRGELDEEYWAKRKALLLTLCTEAEATL